MGWGEGSGRRRIVKEGKGDVASHSHSSHKHINRRVKVRLRGNLMFEVLSFLERQNEWRHRGYGPCHGPSLSRKDL